MVFKLVHEWVYSWVLGSFLYCTGYCIFKIISSKKFFSIFKQIIDVQLDLICTKILLNLHNLLKIIFILRLVSCCDDKIDHSKMRWYYRSLCNVISGGSVMIKLRWYYTTNLFFEKFLIDFTKISSYLAWRLWFRSASKLGRWLRSRNGDSLLLLNNRKIMMPQFNILNKKKDSI